MKTLALFLFLSLPLVASQTCSQWSETKDFNTANGKGVTANTLEECQQKCLSDSSNCANGFDWIYVATSGIRCFISITSTIKSASGYSHYTCASNPVTTTQPSRIVTTAEPKPTGGTVVWTETKDTNTDNGVLKTEYGTLQACQTACYAQKDTNCRFGIDFNPTLPAGSGCYFSTTAKLNVGAYPGTSHYSYELQRETVCSLSEEKDKNSPKGVLDTSATTIKLCEESCKAKENCKYGFDWNSGVPAGSQCYISVSDARSDYPGVSHYSVVCQKECNWVETKDKNSPRGNLMGNYNTRLECQQACFAAANTEKCKYGYDYQEGAPNGFKCYFSISKTLTSFPGVNHWDPQCEDDTTICTFTEMANMNSPNGIVQSSLNTVDECKLRCRVQKDTNCKYGFDFVASNVIGQRCWFSTTETTKSAPGVTHYKIDCSSGGGGTTGVTGTPNACVWTETVGQNTRNGKQESTANTLDECQKKCISMKDTDCKYGIDFNPSALTGLRCWFATTMTLNPQSGVNHYNYDCSAASCTWNVAQDKNTRNGVAQSLNTLEECRAGCLAAKDTTCKYGFDWQVQGTPNFKCFFSTDPKEYPAPGIQHHTLSCLGQTTDGAGGTGIPGQTTLSSNTLLDGVTFTETANKNSPGGAPQATANTLQACKEVCAADLANACKYGFDFNPTSPDGEKCWLSTNNLLFDATGITHYKPMKVEKCTWIVTTNSNTANGLFQIGLNTLESCQAKCEELKATTCSKGLDFNTLDNTCYFSTTDVVKGGAQGINHYSCQGSGPTTVPQSTSTVSRATTTFPLKCTWKSEPNKNSPGGQAQNFNTLGQCQNQCALLFSSTPPKGCLFGLDFDEAAPDGSKCFFSTQDATSEASGVVHYTCS